MGFFSIFSGFFIGRPLPIQVGFFLVSIPEVIFYTCVSLWYMVAIWGLNADSSVVVLPFLLPGFAKAFYTFGIAMMYKDMPSPLVCTVGAAMCFMSCVTTIFAYMYDWPGMTRLSFFHDTALTDLAREQSQVLGAMIFILLTPKVFVDFFSGLGYILVGVLAFMRRGIGSVIPGHSFMGGGSGHHYRT